MVEFKHPSNIHLYSSPGGGKTYMMCFIIMMFYQLKKLHWLNVITGTVSQKDWGWLDKKCIITDDEETRKRLGAPDGVNLYDWYVRNKLIPYAKTCKKPGLVIIDDLTGSVNFLQNHWNQLFTNYRHYCEQPGAEFGDFSVVIATHFPTRVPPTVRETATDVFMFQTQSMPAIVQLFKSYGSSAFGTVKEFNDYLQRFTNRDNHMVLLYKKNPPQGEKMFQPIIAPSGVKMEAMNEGNKKRAADDKEEYNHPQEHKRRLIDAKQHAVH
jgi:hypothetical protein